MIRLTQKLEKDVNKYSKEQLINSKKYVHIKDILNVVLEENKIYSFKEADQLIKKFKESEVK